MSNKYFPALIICAGGTGVKVGRFLQSLADSELDMELKQRIDSGSIQIVGIDTDKKSNEEVLSIDPNLLDAKDTPDTERERIPLRLSKLPRNWLHLDRQALNHAIERVHDVFSPGDFPQKDDVEFHEPLATIREWFPLKNEKTGDQITKGHSKLAGAAQWRPLGRMSLFLNAQRIFETLQRSFRIVQQSDPELGPVRAFIVCSLAGGTGSGMFWDLAFMLQMIDPSTQTSGMFLLGDPFEGVDEAGRIYPNIYASLKEIATYKNWREPFTVTYPISRGRTFKGQAQGPLAYDMVYLYQAFSPGPDVSDVSKGTIEATCYRLSQNMLSLIRKDVHAELDVGANNMDSDATSMTSQLESSYCFSTTGTAAFFMHDPAQLAEFIRYQVLKSLRPPIYQLPAPVDEGELAQLLPWSSLMREALEDWRNQVLDQIALDLPPALEEALRAITQGIESADDGGISIIERLDQFTNRWIESFKKALDTGDRRVTMESIEAFYIEKLREKVDELVTKVGKALLDLKAKNRPLSREALAALEAIRDELRKELPESYEKSDFELSLELDPGAGSLCKNRDGHLVKIIARIWDALTGLNWIDIARKMKLGQTLQFSKDSLEAQRKRIRQKIEPLLNQIWNENRDHKYKSLDQAIEYSRQVTEESALRKDEDEKIQATFNLPVRTERDFSKSMMNELLRSILPPTDEIESWLEEKLPRLVSILKRHYPDISIDNEFKEQIDPTKIREALTKLYKDLKDKFLTDKSRLPPEVLVHFIKDCLPEPEFKDGEGARNLIRTIGELTREIVQFWNAAGDMILLEAGGQDTLRERLQRCKTKLFVNGIIENKINKKHLTVLPFSHSSSRYNDEEKRRIKETFDVVSQEVMHTNSIVVYQSTNNPVVFSNDLFRSAEEIARIRDYFDSYRTYSESGNTTFFHIHRDIAGIQEIVGNAIEVVSVYCGNEACVHDLRRTDRTTLICPGCRKPIWNRCGNRKCYADNLKNQIKETTTPAGKHRYPFECPACCNELKTYWWRCPDKDHTKKVPSDKETCPQCLIEFQQGIRVHTEVHRRPDLRDLECPGCLKLEKDPENRVRIPDGLRLFYERGVNGHDTLHFRDLLEKFRQERKRCKVSPHQCENSGEEHFLFPTCPESLNSPDKIHHLYLNDDGRFVCTRHPRLEFYQCNYCNYPLKKGDHYSHGCPRCLRAVKHCDFCTDKFNRLYTPIEGSAPERCPNCTNLMSRKEFVDRDDALSGLEEGGFCANIFSCPAGAHLWSTAANYHLKSCRCCPEPASPLYPRNDLEDLVLDCPLCSQVLGPIQIDGRIEYFKPEKIEERFKKKYKDKGKQALNRSCIVCGSETRLVLAWMRDLFPKPGDDSKTMDKQSEVTQEETHWLDDVMKDVPFIMPDIPFIEALEILQTFREESDDQRAFFRMKALLGLDKVLNGEPHRQETMLSVFEKGSRVSNAIRKRLVGMWKGQHDLKERTQDWIRKPVKK